MPWSPAKRQLTIVVTTLLASLSTGAGMGFPSILLYQLRRNDSEIPINLDIASWIGSIHSMGGIFGVIAPVIMQWRGRKFTFIAACVILIAGWAFAYTANSIAILLFSETLHGFSASVLLALSYDCLSEMITPDYRNVAVQFYNIVNVLGVALPGILTMFISWRNVCIILGLPAIIAIVMSCTWLESPLWLAYKNDLDKCKVNFTKLRGSDDLSVKELKEVVFANSHIKKRNRTKKFKQENQENMTIQIFWRKIARRDFLVPALHVIILMNLTYWSGIVVVLLYSIELISKSTQNENAAFVGGIVLNFSLIFGSTVSALWVKYYKNKPIILLSTAGATICLLAVSIVTYLQSIDILEEKSLIVLYLLIAYMIIKSLGGTLGFTMSAELMPVKHRGIGGAMFVVLSNILQASVLKSSPYLFEFIGLWATFLIYTVNCFISGLLIWKYIPETKGRTLQEIEHFYENGTFHIDLGSDAEEMQQINVKT